MALVTVADLAKATGRTLTTGTPAGNQAQHFCDLVDAFISTTVGYVFTSTTITECMQADYYGVITLSNRPVTAVSSVKTPTGLTVTGWTFDYIDEVTVLDPHQVVNITYTAGYTTPPADLKVLAISVASRLVVNPDGVRQKTVGAISETLAATEGSAGTVFFTAMEKEILSNYVKKMDTWRLGPRYTPRYTDLPTL